MPFLTNTTISTSKKASYALYPALFSRQLDVIYSNNINIIILAVRKGKTEVITARGVILAGIIHGWVYGRSIFMYSDIISM